MSLIHCPECANTISDQSVSCPHCGYPIAEKLRAAQPPVPPPQPVPPVQNIAQQPQQPLPVTPSEPSRNLVALLGFGVVILLAIILMVTCSKSSDEEATPVASTPKSTTKVLRPVVKSIDTSKFLPIPMRLSGAPEDGRYFLMSHDLLANGIHEITYLRTRNPNISDSTDTYGKMQLNCGLTQIRTASFNNQAALANADLGDWYTPTPNWTDRDIFNFICESNAIADAEQPADETATTSDTPTEATDSTATASADNNSTPSNNDTAPSATTDVLETTPTPKPSQSNAQSKPSESDNIAKLIAERENYTKQITDIVKGNWQLPMKPEFRTVRASFNIAPDGTISNIKVDSKDMYAKSTLTQAIESSSPLPPIPKGSESYFAENNLTFRVNQ